MNRKITLVPAIILAALILFIISLFAGLRQTIGSVTAVKSAVVTYGDTTETKSFPFTIKDLQPGDTVTITFTISPKSSDVLFFKSVYAPITIFSDDDVIYRAGFSGTYPSFFSDPPTIVDSVALPATDSSETITLEYQYPNKRNGIFVSTPLIGSNSDILRYFMSSMGLLDGAAAVEVILGFLLIFLSIFISPMIHGKNFSLLWLGLFAILSGLWSFSECNLTVYITKSFSLLYMTSFMSLFLIPVPLILFAKSIIKLNYQKLLTIILGILLGSFCGAVILQLLRLVPFSQSMYLFHILIPLSLSPFLAGLFSKRVLMKTM